MMVRSEVFDSRKTAGRRAEVGMKKEHLESQLEPGSCLPAPSMFRLLFWGPGTRVSLVLRGTCILLALVHAWMFRGVMDPDGVSYSDIANAMLKGDWQNALSSYWSPLYSWLLGVGYAIFQPGIEWKISISHLINLLGFVAALLAWEWLFREWEHWKGPPAHRTLIEVAGYSAIAWAGFHLVTIAFTSADMEVMALMIVLAALLLRVRRGVAGFRDFICIGLALGFGFLAKAALSVLIPILLVELAILISSWRDKRIYSTVGIALLIPLPFVFALSIAKGHPVLSDTGRLNYSWQVTGMSVEGYKENAYWPGSEARHPITRLMDSPRVIGFGSHLVGTSPVHFDPAWWSEGYRVRFDRARQLMILKSNLAYFLTRFAFCPALWFALVCCISGAGFRIFRSFAQLWFVWLPAVVLIGSYCLIYALNRYLAGPFILLGFSLIAAGWNTRLPQWITITAPVAILAFLTFADRQEIVEVPRLFFGSLSGKETDPVLMADIRLAETLRKQDFHPQDKAALIGDTLLVSWLSLLEGQSVAAVPSTIRFNDRLFGRPQESAYEKPDFFWRSDLKTQEDVLNTFRSQDAKWVFANNIPRWADVSGWTNAGRFPAQREGGRPDMYYKKL